MVATILGSTFANMSFLTELGAFLRLLATDSNVCKNVFNTGGNDELEELVPFIEPKR